MLEYLIVLGLVIWAICDLVVPIILVTGFIAACKLLKGKELN